MKFRTEALFAAFILARGVGTGTAGMNALDHVPPKYN